MLKCKSIFLQKCELQEIFFFRLILSKEPIADNVDFEGLARSTEGFSGSDLKELCRNASVYRVRDYIREREPGGSKASMTHDSDDEYHDTLRPITMEDLKFSFNRMREGKIQCGSLSLQTRIDLD